MALADTPRTALTQYHAAALAGDVDGVRSLAYYGPGDHAAYATASAEEAVAQAAFGSALERRFGVTAAKPYESQPGSDARAIAAGRETIEGDRATVEVSGRRSPIALVKIAGGGWMIDYTSQTAGPGTGELPTRAMRLVAQVMHQNAARIDAGDYASPADAMTTTLRDVRQAVEPLAAGTTRPSRRS